MSGDTICALATAVGEGAVGIVRLSGPAALDLLEQVTGQRPAARRLVTAAVCDPGSGERVDHALVCAMPAPRSYTGEDVAEVHGHGGALNLERLLALFVRLGARPAEPGEFTRRAFVNGRLDLTQVEAVARVIAARSERALRNAQAVLDGALGDRVRALRAAVIALAADLEACIDFADELDAPVAADAIARQHRALAVQLRALASTYDEGRRLDGVSVALRGPVNAGKSSLFNALLGGERALVSDEAGTTRDYLEADVVWDGLRVTLVDTAGSRPVALMSALERAGYALSRARLQRCDASLWVFDVEAGPASFTEDDADVAAGDGSPRVVVANKVDTLADDSVVAARCAAARDEMGAPVVAVSAQTGRGLDALRRSVVDAVFGHDGERGGGGAGESAETVCVTERRQWDALVRATACVETGTQSHDAGRAPELVVEHIRGALSALGEVTGEAYTEQVLDSVFARFCIGK